MTDLPWRIWPWHKRCHWTGGDRWDWGRCELRRGHTGDCALDRGTHVHRFNPVGSRVYQWLGEQP